MVLDTASPVPLYQQIADEIKARVLTGELQQGDPLPSIRQLAADLVTSVITTKRAYQELEALGLIQTLQGRGTFVSKVSAELSGRLRQDEIRNQLREITRRASRLGLRRKDLLRLMEDVVETEEFNVD